jgi:hypothetical protein
LFLLTSSLADSKVHANEWNQPKLLLANQLQKGNYFHCTRFGALQTGSLFGVPQNGTDTDIRDGGRQLQERKGKADKDSAPTLENEGGNADPGAKINSDPGPADPGPAESDAGPDSAEE